MNATPHKLLSVKIEIHDEDIIKRRDRAYKCRSYAAECRKRAKDILDQAEQFDRDATLLIVDANRLEALRVVLDKRPSVCSA